jgi:hypothetical protein
MTKRLLILALLFTVAYKLNAQDFPKKGDYMKNPELINLAGTWQGIKGSDTFTIVLEYRQKMPIGPLFADAIIGWHSYSENGVIESTSLIYKSNDKKGTVFVAAGKKINSGKDLILQFSDPNRSRSSVEVSFTPVPGKTNEAIWKVKNFHEETMIHIEGQPRKVRPPVSKITAVPEWHMKKIN